MTKQVTGTAKPTLKAALLSSLLALAAVGASALAADEGQERQGPATAQQENDADVALRDRPGEREEPAERDPFEPQQLEPGLEMSQQTVGALHGSEVINAQGEVIGSIRDLAVSRQDEQLHAIVDVGGWLGIGGTQIAVPVEAFEITDVDQVRYPTEATQDEIQEVAEDYDDQQYVSLGEEEMRLSVYLDERDGA